MARHCASGSLSRLCESNFIPGKIPEGAKQCFSVHDLKRNIASQYDQKKFLIECESAWMKEYVGLLSRYLSINGMDNIDPMIEIRVSGGNAENLMFKQTELLSFIKKDSEINYHVKSIYKDGVIPMGTVIGQFVGFEYFCDEILKREENCLFLTRNGCIPCVMSLNDFSSDCDTFGTFGTFGNVSDIVISCQQCALDVCNNYMNNNNNLTGSGGFDCLLSRMSDCREFKNILNNSQWSHNEYLKCNVIWLYCKVNGWPARFAVTMRDIGFDQVLFSYHDWNYSKFLKRRIKYLKEKDYVMDGLDKMFEMELNLNKMRADDAMDVLDTSSNSLDVEQKYEHEHKNARDEEVACIEIMNNIEGEMQSLFQDLMFVKNLHNDNNGTPDEWHICGLPCALKLESEIRDVYVKIYKKSIYDYLDLNGLNNINPRLLVERVEDKGTQREEQIIGKKRKFNDVFCDSDENTNYMLRKDVLSLVNDKNDLSGIVANVFLPKGTVIAQYSGKINCCGRRSNRNLNQSNGNHFELMANVGSFKECVEAYTSSVSNNVSKERNEVGMDHFGKSNESNASNTCNLSNVSNISNNTSNSSDSSNSVSDSSNVCNSEDEEEEDYDLGIDLINEKTCRFGWKLNDFDDFNKINVNFNNLNHFDTSNDDDADGSLPPSRKRIKLSSDARTTRYKSGESAKDRRVLDKIDLIQNNLSKLAKNFSHLNVTFALEKHSKNKKTSSNKLEKNACKRENTNMFVKMDDPNECNSSMFVLNDLLLYGMNVNRVLCNISYFWCNINGWPQLIFVTNEDICKGSVLIRKLTCDTASVTETNHFKHNIHTCAPKSVNNANIPENVMKSSANCPTTLNVPSRAPRAPSAPSAWPQGMGWNPNQSTGPRCKSLNTVASAESVKSGQVGKSRKRKFEDLETTKEASEEKIDFKGKNVVVTLCDGDDAILLDRIKMYVTAGSNEEKNDMIEYDEYLDKWTCKRDVIEKGSVIAMYGELKHVENMEATRKKSKRARISTNDGNRKKTANVDVVDALINDCCTSFLIATSNIVKGDTINMCSC